MWFGYENDSTTWHPITLDQVNEILKMNAKGEKPVSLDVLEIQEVVLALPTVGINSDLAKMDKKFSSRDQQNNNSNNNRKNKKKKSGGMGNNPASNVAKAPVAQANVEAKPAVSTPKPANNPNKGHNSPKGRGERK
jgi:hypothetical protein